MNGCSAKDRERERERVAQRANIILNKSNKERAEEGSEEARARVQGAGLEIAKGLIAFLSE